MKVMGIIMAGGKGARLYPLTKERSKPAVPFGGKYRIIDFVLSNFVNSGILANYILVQYLSQSLIDYLRVSWRSNGLTRDQFITVVPPQMRLGDMWYRGTADAVKQNLNLIKDYSPDMVAVFGADHIYRMDISQMIKFHEENKADVTVAALPVPIRQSSHLGVISVDARNRITVFDEKPQDAKSMPGNPSHCYASMGNYIFNYDALFRILHEESHEAVGLDFAKAMLPSILKRYRVFAYDFPSQKLPGLKNREDGAYWRDVGSLDLFWQTHMDLLGHKPKLDLNNPAWPIHSGRFNAPPAKILGADIHDCMLGTGCVIYGSSLKRCLLARGVTIHEKCQLEECIIMDSCEIKAGTKLKKVIIDRFNSIGPRTVIGHDPDTDAQHYYIDPSGIAVIPRGISKWQ
ncbi:MAG: glucose-1-phosphate adenylyltransferase [bacterium]